MLQIQPCHKATSSARRPKRPTIGYSWLDKTVIVLYGADSRH